MVTYQDRIKNENNMIGTKLTHNNEQHCRYMKELSQWCIVKIFLDTVKAFVTKKNFR